MSEPQKAVQKADDSLRYALTKLTPEFGKVLQGLIPPDKFVRIAINALQKNPDLEKCERNSVFYAFMKCAEDGLCPDGREAFINVYYNKETKRYEPSYQPMWLGFVSKIIKSGFATDVEPMVVYEKDHFKEWVDITGKHFEHEISRDVDRGEITHAYVLIALSSGKNKFESITRAEIEAARAKSRQQDGLMWGKFFPEGCKKTAIKRCLKRIPNLPPEVASIIAHDNENFDMSETTASVEPAAPQEKKQSRLHKAIGKAPEDPPQASVKTMDDINPDVPMDDAQEYPEEKL